MVFGAPCWRCQPVAALCRNGPAGRMRMPGSPAAATVTVPSYGWRRCPGTASPQAMAARAAMAGGSADRPVGEETAATPDQGPSPQNEPAVKHKRRVRYSGLYPRAFGERYKELSGDANALTHVREKGSTPAGTHISIMMAEVLAALRPLPGDFAVDCTFGYGGHASSLLRAVSPGGTLLALDVDPVELLKSEARLRTDLPAASLIVRHTNFAGLGGALAAAGVAGADVLLADLGLSSMQIDDPSRGFTFKADAPLDCRMNQKKGKSAAELLAAVSGDDLASLLTLNADEPFAEAIADALVRQRSRRPIATTRGLAEAVHSALPPLAAGEADRSVRRVFQALRIAVNDEFGALDSLLRQLPCCMNAGGRVAILAFHSGEDRRVKRAFKEGLLAGDFSSISDDAARPSPEERRANPRSSPAKLRWAVKAKA